jgi:hypothetical protein
VAEAIRNNLPAPNQKNTSIGKGHLLQATVWDEPNVFDSIGEYCIYGVSKNIDDAYDQMDRYFAYHRKRYNIDLNNVDPREYEDEEYNPKIYYKKDHGAQESYADGHVVQIHKDGEKPEAYGWSLNCYIPFEEHKYPLEEIQTRSFVNRLMRDVEGIHKDLYDYNNTKTAKVYTTVRNEEGIAFTKVADRLMAEEVGLALPDDNKGNLGADIAPEDSVRKQTDPLIQPGGTLNNSFDMLASVRYAEVEEMNYEGVGTLFGQGMGPQDAAENITDVEEGPRDRPRPEKSPMSQQGQSVLPDVTSWFTASHHDDDEYSYDDYDDNYDW